MNDSVHNPGIGVQQVVAGTLAGVFSRVCTHPIGNITIHTCTEKQQDTIKTRMQARTYEVNNSNIVSAIRSEGWRGLYRGFGVCKYVNLEIVNLHLVATVLSIPALSVYLTTYDNVKYSLFSYYPSLSEWKVHLVSGLGAEALSGVLWTPMEVIKQRLQIQINDKNVKYSSSVNAIKSVYYNEGIMGFFKGYGMQLGVFGPFSMLNFVLYEYFKSLQDKNNLTFGYLLSTSLIAASVSSIATTPLGIYLHF